MSEARGTLLRLTLMGGQARAFLCDTTGMAQAAREIHGASNVCTAALGRMISAAAMLGAQLKGEDERVTATIRGGGPAGTLTAVAGADGAVKVALEEPRVELPLRADGKLDVGGAVGKGRLTVVRDLGLREPYVGQVELVNGEIAMDFTYYFATSEQQPTLLSLGVLMPDAAHSAELGVLSAGGLLIQPLPGCSEELLSELERRAGGYADISRQLIGETPDELCARFFEGLAPRIVERRAPAYRCDCDRERIERALISLGRAELRELIDQDHGAQLECHFCNRRYHFSAEQLEELLERATAAD